MTELRQLQTSLPLGDDDVKALRQSKAIRADQTDAILDVWFGFVASTPHLVHFVGNATTGQPDAADLEAVRKRFAPWILDTAADVEKMHAAWVKAVLLQSILWSQP